MRNSRGEFMRHANFCDALAVAVKEPAEKAALSEMAERWREFAKHVPVLPVDHYAPRREAYQLEAPERH